MTIAGDSVGEVEDGLPAKHPGRQPWERDLLALMRDVAVAADGGPVGSVDLGGGRHHLVSSVAGARQVLVDHRDRYATMPFPLTLLAPVITDSGRTLLRLRPAASGASRPGMPLAEAIDAAGDAMVLRLQEAARADNPVATVPFFKTALLGLMTRVLFGLQPEAGRVERAARGMAWLERYRAAQLAPGNLALDDQDRGRLQSAFAVEYQYARDLLLEAGYAGIDPHRAIPGFDNLRAWGAQDHLVQSVARLLMNAYNGPAVALAWTMWRLAQNPEIREEVAHEAAAVAGGLRYESSGSLTMTRGVVQETLRLHPPAWALGRLVQADDVIEGCPVRQGEIVTVSTYRLHRHPDHWADPEVFHPGRFAATTGKSATTLADAYLPFGAGTSGCPAGAFAVRELQYLVARFAAAFAWDLASDAAVQPWALVSLHPDPDVAIRLQAFE